MAKRRSLILVLFLLSLGIFFFLKTAPPIAKSFVKLPVSFFPFIDQPKISVEIENKKYSLLIDLGSSHPIDLHKGTLQGIKNKKPLEITPYVGIRGKRYSTQAFQLPEVKLSNLVIDGLIGFEENLDFIKDARTSQICGLWNRFKDRLELLTVDGRIGWTIFNEGTVFLDFPHSTLVVAKNMDALIHEAGYSLGHFALLPFELEKWGLVLIAETDFGPQRFLLDTGATCSILRLSLFPEDIEARKSPYLTNKFRIGSEDFGHWTFRLFNYSDQIECDGILGVDFFKKHTICLDFHSKTAYIKRPESLAERARLDFFSPSQ